MGPPPSQPVAIAPPGKLASDLPAGSGTISPDLIDELWPQSDASNCGLDRDEFARILASAGEAHNFGQPPGAMAAPRQRADYLRALRVADLTLARACALGKDLAWERFVAHYREPLTRAAIAIARNETEGRELAGGLHAELYGLRLRDGQRRCPLDSYHGRGSLMGWLRATLAQRHVDRFRKTWREEPLPDPAIQPEPPAPNPAPATPPEQLALLAAAVQQSLAEHPAEDRFLLAAYYLDQRTLLQIASLLGVHEATVSRRLRRAVDGLRKRLLRNLQDRGLSKRAAEEALAADPRDLTGMSDLDRSLKKLLQFSQTGAFPEEAGR